MSRKRGARRTLLKIRATPLKRMPKSHFYALIRQACREGVIPLDIQLSTLNWDHARGRQYAPGSVLSARDAKELKNCYNYIVGGITKQDVRVERPE